MNGVLYHENGARCSLATGGHGNHDFAFATADVSILQQMGQGRGAGFAFECTPFSFRWEGAGYLAVCVVVVGMYHLHHPSRRSNHTAIESRSAEVDQPGILPRVNVSLKKGKKKKKEFRPDVVN